MAKSARALGGSIAGFRAFEMAAGEAGVDAGNLRAEIQNLDRALASGRADAAMRALGLSAAELGKMDVDKRLASIADAIADTGLSAGQTGALLQSMGIENRDMALLLSQGGDALRAARGDVEAYGLAMSGVDAAKIEVANDAIGRLAIVGQYARQELAEKMIPALGRFSEAITASMREGGALRGVIDGVVQNLGRFATYAATAGALFAGQFAIGVGVAAAATVTLSGALTVLRGALIRTGLGALIVGAGELVFRFSRLVENTGSLGAAFVLLGEVASGVWQGIREAAGALEPALNSVWQGIKADFLIMMSGLTENWGRFLSLVAEGLPKIPGIETGVAAALNASALNALGRAGQLDAQAAAAGRESASSGNAAAGIASKGFATAAAALGRLRKEASQTITEAGAAAAAIGSMSDAAMDLGGAEGGSSGTANAAANGVKQLTGAAQAAAQAAARVGQSFENAFVGLVTRTATLRSALSQLAADLAKMAAQAAFKSLFGGLFTGGSFFGKLFGGGFANGAAFSGGQVIPFANGGIVAGPTLFPMAGGMTGLMGEAGAEAIMPLARGADGRLGGASKGAHVQVSIVAGEYFDARVERIAGPVSAQVTATGMAQVRRGIPDIMTTYQQRGLVR